MLLAGKPVLVVPTVAEQYMLGRRVEALGAGRLARPDDTDGPIGGLLTLLRTNSYRDAARKFGSRYRSMSTEHAAAAIVDAIECFVR